MVKAKVTSSQTNPNHTYLSGKKGWMTSTPTPAATRTHSILQDALTCLVERTGS